MRSFGLIVLLFHSIIINAQVGILPFTGLRYVENGIHCKDISVNLEGEVWTGNHLPIKTTFVIALEDPQGFTSFDGTYYPEIEILLTRPNGDTLAYAPGVYGEGFGFSEASLKKLSLDLGFNESMNTGDTCNVKARFFDTKGTNEITCFLQVILVSDQLPLETTEMTYGVSASNQYNLLSSGVKVSDCNVSLTEHRTLPFLIQIDQIEGINRMEWEEGTKTIVVYDEQFNPISQGINGLNYVIKDEKHPDSGYIEYRMKGNEFIRIRWESKNREKVIDAVFEPAKKK